jgi:hypothetical protein
VPLTRSGVSAVLAQDRSAFVASGFLIGLSLLFWPNGPLVTSPVASAPGTNPHNSPHTLPSHGAAATRITERSVAAGNHLPWVPPHSVWGAFSFNFPLSTFDSYPPPAQ